MELKGKSVLITGASSGIGKSFAYLLASKGSDLIIVARSINKLKEIATDISSQYNVSVRPYQSDLSVLNAAKDLYDKLQADQVDVDILINNAGYGKWGDFTDFTLEEYQKMVQLNVVALMDLCYLFLEDLKKKPAAGIINVGSTASFIPVPYSAVYGATKAFVLYFTEALVGELENSNVVVHCLCPSGTATNFANVASDGGETAPRADMKTADQVAQEGLDAFQAGKHYIVTGRTLYIFLARILSRGRIIKMVASYWKKRLRALNQTA